MIIEEIKAIKSDRKELKKFGLTIGLVFLSLSVFFLLKNNYLYIYSGITALLLILSGLIFPTILTPVHKGWMILAVILGFVSTRIILTLLFYLIITPIAILGRLSGKNFLDEKISPSSKSYWNYSGKDDFSKSSAEKQF